MLGWADGEPPGQTTPNHISTHLSNALLAGTIGSYIKCTTTGLLYTHTHEYRVHFGKGVCYDLYDIGRRAGASDVA